MSNEQNKFPESEVEQLARRFESGGVTEILEWAVERFGPRLVMTSSFGAEGIVLIDHLAQVASDTPIIYLDTGFHFPETERLKERMQVLYNLNLIEQRAALSVAQQAEVYGDKLYERDPDLCCRLRKVEPLRESLTGYDAWVAALRRDQSPTRANIRVVEWNAKRQMVKINPLATWTRKQVWDYIVKNDLPYNSLYDEGYTSIGCEPCTRRPAAGAHERSGRWDGLVKLECGIHL
ncbi:MAG TPA: phosphoadenylyl-sulfate reductase [Blastocatellia bacterium]|nr:phosphoadenylyl-sulfate reductase [Blastocatellia bacterium]